MSFRDIMTFVETMKTLGYKRLISMENFRTPNFPLVAEILQWLVTRYDQNAIMDSLEFNNSRDRIAFINYITEFMLTKANIKINPRRLYEADRNAVKELLKITTILNKALKEGLTSSLADEEFDSTEWSLLNQSFTKIDELKEAQSLAQDVTENAANIYFALEKEVDYKFLKMEALCKQPNLNIIEQIIDAYSEETEKKIEKTIGLLENLASDELKLEAKIEQRSAEIVRSSKRLETLKSIRPLYMDEYEEYEKELDELYEQYIEKFLNMSYLEDIWQNYNNIEGNSINNIQLQILNNKKRINKMKREQMKNKFLLPNEEAENNGEELINIEENEENNDTLDPWGNESDHTIKNGDMGIENKFSNNRLISLNKFELSDYKNANNNKTPLNYDIYSKHKKNNNLFGDLYQPMKADLYPENEINIMSESELLHKDKYFSDYDKMKYMSSLERIKRFEYMMKKFRKDFDGKYSTEDDDEILSDVKNKIMDKNLITNANISGRDNNKIRYDILNDNTSGRDNNKVGYDILNDNYSFKRLNRKGNGLRLIEELSEEEILDICPSKNMIINSHEFADLGLDNSFNGKNDLWNMSDENLFETSEIVCANDEDDENYENNTSANEDDATDIEEDEESILYNKEIDQNSDDNF